MEAIKLVVKVTAAVAVRAGSPLAGETTVTLTPEVLGELTEDERTQFGAVLAPDGKRPGAFCLGQRTPSLGMWQAAPLALPSPDTSPAAVVEALRTRLADERAAYEKALAEDREEFGRVVKRALAVKPEGRSGFVSGDRWFAYGPDGATLARAAAQGFPGAVEAQEHLRTVNAEVVRLNNADLAAEAERYCALPLDQRMHRDGETDWEATAPLGFRYAHDIERRLGPAAAAAFQEAHAAAIARTTAERAERAEVNRRAKEALVAFARTVPELAQAAREGYDVRRGVADELARRVASVPHDHGIFLESETYVQGGRGWEPLDWEDAPSPAAALFALRARIAAHVATVEHPEGTTITVARIARVITEDTNHTDYSGNPTKRKRRGIVVVIDGTVIQQRVVVFPAE